LNRVRWPDELDPKLRKWLTRAQRALAHLRSTILIYSDRRNVGGDSLIGNTAYRERAAAADRTLLYDALTVALEVFSEVREEIQVVMDSVPPTDAQPGSPDKVAVMEQRARAGYSIFVDNDARQ
jgi:hypothetical protein